jgi:CPA2 family monovalent cation:H+ antiporter-2
MALVPLLAKFGRQLGVRFKPEAPVDPELTRPPTSRPGDTIVVGYGRVGKVVCELLRKHDQPFVAVDLDALGVSRDRRQGHPVHYGDASNASFLKTCGIGAASAVIITINASETIDDIVGMVRQLRPDIPIFSRAKDASHARHLYGVGVTDAVPETIEASLQLSETALVGIGVPMGLVIASIHGKRDEFREELQSAARGVGLMGTHAVRPKSGVVP